MTYYTRAQWGAAPPTRSMARLDPKRVRYWTLHFDGSSALGLRDLRTLMRAFQRYHQKTRDFADIAYNSAAGQSGDRAEGRGAYVGGHLLAGQNAESWGCIAAIGATEVPTPALLAALREDYEAACKWAGRRLIPRGHTQWPDANKACPGTHLMRFLTTLTLPPKPSPPPTSSAPLQEDIMATTDELRQIIREELHALMSGTIPVSAGTDRAWTTTRDAALAEAAELGKVRLPDGTIKRTDDVLGELAEFLTEVREAGEDEIRKAMGV